MKKLLIIVFFSGITLVSCRFVGNESIRGNSSVTSETRSVSGFSGIEVGGAMDVYLMQDSITGVKIETDQNLMEYIQTGVKDNTLEIRSERGFNLRPSRKIKVYVSSPDIRYIEASGACNIIGQNTISGNDLIEIRLSGASNITMNVKAPAVDSKLSGAGTISLSGETKDFSASGSGSTDIKCFDLKAENTKVKITGSGDAEVFASVNLDVRVSGAGSVRYRGNPSIDQHISGAGNVKKAD
jgi:hypothetical protein